ncbi:MAG: helix-turn-helix domain-containing protein [Candidatus Latescibacterota bacterium]|nr:MAG: helix-turn-helix domain-containing protein [Candidatus Latescibacterota bacterium]
MDREVKEAMAVRRKLLVLEMARVTGNVVNTCREFEVPRSTFYNWKKAYEREGKAGLVRKKPIAYHHPRRISPEAMEKIL